MQAADAVSIYTGKAVSWLIFLSGLPLVYEVLARYAFSAPTIWAEDLSFMVYGAYFMLGAAYTLQRQMHIRTDFFYRNWSPRTKGLVDGTLYLFVFFPAMILFLVEGWGFAWDSYSQNECIATSAWMPCIWPLKMAIPLSTILLLIQGVSEFLKSFYTFKTGVMLVQEAEIET